MNNHTKKINALLTEWRNWLINGEESKSDEVDYITYVFCKMIEISMHYELYILRLFFLNRQRNDTAESFFNRYEMSDMLPQFYEARGFFLTELNNCLNKKYMVLIMQMSEKGIELIRTFEGCRLEAYQDSGRRWQFSTINTAKKIKSV